MDEFDLTPFRLVIGEQMPDWAGAALDRGDIVPNKPVRLGDYDWGDAGMRVVRTGEVFPLGSWMMKGDLLSRSV